MLTRRELLHDAATVLAAVALRDLAFSNAARAQAQSATDISRWPRVVQSQIGVAFQHPPGWTVRVQETGMAGAAEGRDGLTGARGWGQLVTVREGTSSAQLITVLAANLGQAIHGFRTVDAVRLSTTPDLSALRFSFPYVDGVRKGTLIMSVKKGGAIALGFDAPAAAYAARLDEMTSMIGTFRWFESSLRLEKVSEPRERAFSIMRPAGWRADLKVIRPQVDAGLTIVMSDPTGAMTVEVSRPRLPMFAAPGAGAPDLLGPEGGTYPLGQRWGWEPLLVRRHLPGRTYLRDFLIPMLKRTRPGLQLAGLGDRHDMMFSPEAGLARAFGGSAAGGEAEYVWTDRNGVRRRGRAVGQTIHMPYPDPRAPAFWYVPRLLLAEAPEPQFNTAVAAMITANASLAIDPHWLAAEIKGSRDRWRIINETEQILWNKYQEAVQYRQKTAYDAAEKWDQTIRHTFAGSSDFGSYVPYGADRIMTSDGRIVPVIELGGQSVDQWMKDNPTGYLKKAW
ncbi:MAG TPA: hypothetical protein VFM39_08465 [bacterium]|nr:hypothetical protein [bacterium]